VKLVANVLCRADVVVLFRQPSRIRTLGIQKGGESIKAAVIGCPRCMREQSSTFASTYDALCALKQGRKMLRVDGFAMPVMPIFEMEVCSLSETYDTDITAGYL
jgi:hypothetical protein